jgi:hypothetical protein
MLKGKYPGRVLHYWQVATWPDDITRSGKLAAGQVQLHLTISLTRRYSFLSVRNSPRNTVASAL